MPFLVYYKSYKNVPACIIALVSTKSEVDEIIRQTFDFEVEEGYDHEPIDFVEITMGLNYVTQDGMGPPML